MFMVDLLGGLALCSAMVESCLGRFRGVLAMRQSGELAAWSAREGDGAGAGGRDKVAAAAPGLAWGGVGLRMDHAKRGRRLGRFERAAGRGREVLMIESDGEGKQPLGAFDLIEGEAMVAEWSYRARRRGFVALGSMGRLLESDDGREAFCEELAVFMEEGLLNVDEPFADVHDDEREWTLLGLAAQEGRGWAVAALLAAGADPSARIDGVVGYYLNVADENGATALHRAAVSQAEGALDCMRLLIGAGCDLEAADRMGATPLGWAAMEDRPAAMILLIEAGAKAEPVLAIGDKISNPDALAMAWAWAEARSLREEAGEQSPGRMAKGARL